MKKVICKSCGAEAEIVTPCTCDDCGIICCGKPMEIVETNDDATYIKEVSCDKCGAKVKVIKECTCDDCGIQCCGTQMK